MCRKLGKGHPEYFDRKANQYVIGADGVKRMRRTYAGRRICDHHGHNVLNAMTEYRDKIWSWFPDTHFTDQCTTQAKTKKLRNLERCTNHGMTRYGKAHRDHLRRNNVSVVRSTVI